MGKLLSLVIPTNGVIEWVFPVLDSIFNQNVDEEIYEVVVTDNGNNCEFKEIMQQYCTIHKNLVYKKTSAVLFDNQIEAFKLASGEFIKFINHRTILKEGALKYLLAYVKANIRNKPISFFLNGVVEPNYKKNYYSDFDSFIYGISFYSSWSGGVACWKKDLSKALNNNVSKIKKSLFPHSCFIFVDEKERSYNIDNRKLFEEIDSNASAKGKYDLFYAFGVEYINIISELKNMKMIDSETESFIKKETEKFIVTLYANYVLLRNDCSYDLSSARISLNKYYCYEAIKIKALVSLFGKIPARLKKVIWSKN